MSDTQRIRQRSEIPEKDKWALTDLFESDESWEEALKSLEEDQQILVSYAGTLGQSAEKLFGYLQHMEQTNCKVSRLAHYCMRKADEDTRDSHYQGMTGRFVSTMVSLEASCSFETPELMAIEDVTLDAFYAACPELERYRRYLSNLRRRKEHILSEAEEKILAATGEMGQAPDNIYGMLTDADLKFADAVDSHGQMHPLSQGTFVPLQESQDRQLRKSAYENLYDGFTGIRNTAAGLLDAQNKQLKFFAGVRRYGSALEAALDSTEVPVSVYENLVEAVGQNVGSMHRYVRLRKKLLGLDSLHFYDIYTPLVKDVDRKIPYEEAKQTVYDALAPLGEEYRRILQEGFDNRWIDVYQNEGKRSGAYSAGAVPHPYVLLNYTGTLDSQFTLAHEMGHALHSYFSNHHQNPIDSGYVIFVAEVASTCNEALLMEYLLGKTQSKKERAYLINHFLDQFKGTLFRQTMFAEFEKLIGERIGKGETLTADVLCAEYKALCEKYYGPDMVVDERIAMEWARIPHFYYDYYVYQYATGYAAAIALSRRILSGENCAVEAYLRFLSGGRSKDPISLLRDAGVDMASAEPVQEALALFETLLDEMETLMEE